MGMGATVSRRGGVMGKIILLVSVFTLLCAGAANAYLYLHFDGINGDSNNSKFKGYSNILTVDWGVTATATVSGGGGGGAIRPVFSDLKWTQVEDSSFVPLFTDIATGKRIIRARVDFTTTFGQTELPYFEMNFDDVLLTGLNLHGTSDSKAAMVDGSFAYGKIAMTYWPTKPDGTRGAAITASYDLAKGGTAAAAGALGNLFALGLSGPTVPSSVPIPASLLLLGSGLAGLVGLRRKFRR